MVRQPRAPSARYADPGLVGLGVPCPEHSTVLPARLEVPAPPLPGLTSAQLRGCSSRGCAEPVKRGSSPRVLLTFSAGLWGGEDPATGAAPGSLPNSQGGRWASRD